MTKSKKRVSIAMINIEVMSNFKHETKTQKPKTERNTQIAEYFAQRTKRIATDKRRTLSFCEFIDKNNITIIRSIIMETPIKNHNNGNYVFHIE